MPAIAIPEAIVKGGSAVVSVAKGGNVGQAAGQIGQAYAQGAAATGSSSAMVSSSPGLASTAVAENAGATGALSAYASGESAQGAALAGAGNFLSVSAGQERMSGGGFLLGAAIDNTNTRLPIFSNLESYSENADNITQGDYSKDTLTAFSRNEFELSAAAAAAIVTGGGITTVGGGSTLDGVAVTTLEVPGLSAGGTAALVDTGVVGAFSGNYLAALRKLPIVGGFIPPEQNPSGRGGAPSQGGQPIINVTNNAGGEGGLNYSAWDQFTPTQKSIAVAGLAAGAALLILGRKR